MSLGPATYELGADLTPLRRDLKAADAEIKKTGAATESAFGKQAAAGMAQADKQARGLRATLSSMVRAPDLKKGLLQGLGLGAGFGTAMVVAQGMQLVTDAIGGAISAAREWESAFAGVKKTVDTTGLSLEQQTALFAGLEQELRGLARTIPITAVELAGLAEAGGALGIARDELTEFARVTALIGTTTDVVAQDAATSLGKIGTVVGLTGDEFERFGNTLVALGNQGASFESEILAIANRMAGTARTIGLTEQGLLGWAAAMSNVGIETEAGASSFQRFALNVQQAAITGTSKLDTLAKVTGMTREAFQELFARDASAALAAVINGLGAMDVKTRLVHQDLLQMNDEIRLRDMLAKLTGNVGNLNDSLGLSTTAWDENRAMTEEAEKRFATLDSQIQLMWNAITELGIALGTALMPAMEAAATFVTGTVVPAIEAAGDAVGFLIGRIQELQGIMQGLEEEAARAGDAVGDVFGRDIANDVANAFRISSTFGIVLFTDHVGDAQGAVQDLGEEMGLLTEDVTDEMRASILAAEWMGVLTDETEDAADKTDDLAANAAIVEDRLGTLGQQARRLSAEAERAVRVSDRLADAMDAVASTSLEGAREEFRSVMKAAEQAAEDETWAALDRQFKRLQAARRAYVRSGEFDSAAIIDAAIRENRELVAKMRLSSLAYRAEAGDRAAIRQLHKQGIDDAGALAKAIRTGDKDQQNALQRTSEELQVVVKDLKKLEDEAAKGVEVKVDVNTLALDDLEMRLAELAGRGQISTPSGGFPRTTYRRGPAVPGTPPPPGRREGRRDTTINLTVNGHPARARTPADIVRTLRRAGRQGDFEPGRQQGQWR